MTLPRDEIVRGMQRDGFQLASDIGKEKVLEESSGFILIGHLRCELVYPDGTRIQKDLGRNRVVDNGLLCAAHVLSGDATYANYRITQFAIGYSAGATESNSTTALAGQLYSTAPTVTHGSTGVASYEISVGKDQAYPGAGNTATINEAGLLATNASPALVTYKVYTPQDVSDSFTLILRWTLTHARV